MLLGIDLGGTKIEGIVLESKEKPIEVIRHRVDTEEKKGYLCLLYTSPSPRDQRGSGLPSCG